MNSKTHINIDSWKRKSTYLRFSKYQYPYFTVCSPLDITSLYQFVKNQELSLYGTIMWTVLQAANQIRAMRFRMDGTDVYVYDQIGVTFTSLKSDQSFGFSNIIEQNNYWGFIEMFSKAKYEVENDIPIIYEDRDDVIYCTCMPSIRINGFINPMPLNYIDCIPRICWGKAELQNGTYTLDISIQVHHALVDGLDVCNFYQMFSKIIQTHFNNSDSIEGGLH